MGFFGLLAAPATEARWAGWQGLLSWALRRRDLHPPCLPRGPQLRPCVTGNRRITFSRPRRAPLTVLSPGNALPLPSPMGHSVSRRGPWTGSHCVSFPLCLSSMPDLTTRVPDWAPLQVLLLPDVPILGARGGGGRLQGPGHSPRDRRGVLLSQATW